MYNTMQSFARDQKISESTFYTIIISKKNPESIVSLDHANALTKTFKYSSIQWKTRSIKILWKISMI